MSKHWRLLSSGISALKGAGKFPSIDCINNFLDHRLNYLMQIIALMMFGLGSMVSPCIVMAANIDVRILIDVSGSMKANDPQNLRIPAVRLVAELMPKGATAGIWTFGEKVDQVLGPSKVDARWKAVALEAANSIHSRGQLTDVEAALQVATRDWGAAERSTLARHVILLTDGMVDVSKQAADNTASRKRILGDELARLKASGAQIHTISLSTDSDRELMTVLAENTDGWSEQIDEAASLQRIFLHIFEQVASPDSIPLLDDRFEVDKSIREMTLLVFHGEGSEPLELVNPHGEILQLDSHPANVHWRAESGYELVTVIEPAKGTWRINTAPDPDNRVLIVTDLKLKLDPLPTNMLTNESITLNAHITERGQFLKREDFLNLLQAELVVSGSDVDAPTIFPIPFDPQQFRFTIEHVIDWPPGDYEFVVRIDGGTFQRERRSKIRIHETPIMFSSNLTEEGLATEIFILADEERVDLESLMGLLMVTKPDGANEVFDLPVFSSGEAFLTIAMPVNGTYKIEPWVVGRSTSGRNLNVKTKPLVAEITLGTDVIESVATIDWTYIGVIVLIGNIIIGLLLGVVWFWLGRRRSIPLDKVELK